MPFLATKRTVKNMLTYVMVVLGTLFLVDAVFIAFDLFPPTHNYGDADMGWRPAPATGRMQVDRCTDFSTGQTVDYVRNEDGVRTTLSVDETRADTKAARIAVTGDSHTDLCAANRETHPGVLESTLRAHGIPTVVLAYGSGRYSPIQAYLAFRTVLRPYNPSVLVMNVYTGNDFFDMLRVDDRPHFVPDGTSYRIAKPVWYLLDDPMVRRRSRVLFALRTATNRSGLRGTFLRIMQLRRLAAEQDAGFGEVLEYLLDLRKATEPTVGYSAAFTAQMLNQQLFFHHFPGSREESVRRVRELMNMIRNENPGILLVMSPLPSYELAGERPVDEALLRVLQRVPVSYESGVREEERLYERLRSLANELEWVFVDNLSALRAYEGSDRLFNKFDYHLLPTASAIVGQTQATAILANLRADQE